MAFEQLDVFPAPEKITIKDCAGDIRVPYERVKAYDDKEFELFIREWVTSFSQDYEVRGFGGAGDKGRDVVAKSPKGEYIYYQCKHYDHQLNPSEFYYEFGKLVYYTYSGEIPLPKEYYIIASHDVGPKLNDLINKPDVLRKELLNNWDNNCKKKIMKTEVPMTDSLKEYILKFDFSIIKTKSIHDIVVEHKKTAFYTFRFGGEFTVKREKNYIVPDRTAKQENVYIKKLLAAISERENTSIKTLKELEEKFPGYDLFIKVNRERFYSAESLKAFSDKYFLSEDYFKELKDDVYYGVVDILFSDDYDNGYKRVNAVMTQAANINLKSNTLCKYDLVHTKDRQGICHQLANERDDFLWTNQD